MKCKPARKNDPIIHCVPKDHDSQRGRHFKARHFQEAWPTTWRTVASLCDSFKPFWVRILTETQKNGT